MSIQVVKIDDKYAIFGITEEQLRALAIATGVQSGRVRDLTYPLFDKVDDEVEKFDPTYSVKYLDVSIDVDNHL